MNKSILANNSVSFYLRILSSVLAIVPVFYIVAMIKGITEYPYALCFIVLGVATEIALLFIKNKKISDFLAIAGTAFLALAMSFFLLGGVLSIADYVEGINFFGDASQFPAIMIYTSSLFISSALSVATCWMK